MQSNYETLNRTISAMNHLLSEKVFGQGKVGCRVSGWNLNVRCQANFTLNFVCQIETTAVSGVRITPFMGPYWPCMIEIAWVDLGRPYPGSYKQETLANRGQKGRSRSTRAIQSCTAIESFYFKRSNMVEVCARNDPYLLSLEIFYVFQ